MSKDTKKVGTLTFHIPHNYGAMLQAYALPKAVETLGYDCEIIHYCFPRIYEWGHIARFSELYEKHGLVGGTLRYAKRFLKGTYNKKLKTVKFESFVYDTMPISKKAYHSLKEMDNMDYDAILFGSDQIWNASITGGAAPEFAGGFECLDKTKKIAYAGSCGRNEFTEEEKEKYYPLLRDFSAVGIREKGLCDSLERDGFYAKHVLDPTLLLTKEQWSTLIESKKCKAVRPKNDYLLVYVFEEDSSVYEFIDKVSKKYGLEVCCIAYDKKEAMKNYRVFDQCGPEEFVSLIAGASRVVTTSFHGTVFSILFEREFYTVPHPTLHERTDSLLSLLGLDERNCKVGETDINEKQDIDWNSVGERLGALRADSLEFIKESIG